MPKDYDNVDFYWTFDGDFLVGPGGDIHDTSDDPLRSLVQEVKTRLMSDQQDWGLFPRVGAGLSALVGQPNTKETAEDGKAKIISALSRDGLVSPDDLSVKYLPVSRDTIMYRLTIAVASTAFNYKTQYVQIKLLYSYTDNNIHFA